MDSFNALTALPVRGFPIRISTDLRLFAPLRLLMPRHSPCALLSLNFFPSLLHEFRKSVIFFAYCSILFPILLRTLLRKNHYILYSVFTKFFVILFFLLSYTALTVYRVLDLLSPILLSLSPRQFVCRYTLTIPY